MASNGVMAVLDDPDAARTRVPPIAPPEGAGTLVPPRGTSSDGIAALGTSYGWALVPPVPPRGASSDGIAALGTSYTSWLPRWLTVAAFAKLPTAARLGS